MLLLHYTGMADGPSAIDWLCNPASQVSSHYVVTEEGHVLQLVPDNRRAWHAGRSFWAGQTDINSVSIGIEIVNGGHDFGLSDFPRAQIDAVEALCRTLIERHGIPSNRVLAHSDVAPSRKRDPGERFPWARLAARGVGHWAEVDNEDLVRPVDPALPEAAALQRALIAYGYGLEPTGRYDAATGQVVEAFQRHFRPQRIDGKADVALMRHLTELLETRRADPGH